MCSKLPPWSGDYHNDMNVEMSYWPIFASNHLELGKPLYEHYTKLIPKFREYCRKFYGTDGIMIICAMDDDGNPIPGWYTVNLWPGNSAWIAHLFWLYYKYSLDKDFLREKAYPFLKGCLKNIRQYLERRRMENTIYIGVHRRNGRIIGEKRGEKILHVIFH